MIKSIISYISFEWYYQVCKLIMIKGNMKYRLESCTIYFAFLKKVTKPLTNKICRMILLYINIPIQIAGLKKVQSMSWFTKQEIFFFGKVSEFCG